LFHPINFDCFQLFIACTYQGVLNLGEEGKVARIHLESVGVDITVAFGVWLKIATQVGRSALVHCCDFPCTRLPFSWLYKLHHPDILVLLNKLLGYSLAFSIFMVCSIFLIEKSDKHQPCLALNLTYFLG